ncbi:glycoside hydrolase family 3 protein [Collybia nuda]|uniref:beta-glucosidase n=1 Tax=Collybia nuda TaxID=64659 RepID=A0A9P5YIQ6_9AGAR|nr:glycoside hydrolase family 3 protein [Collybia nuda]
MAFRALPALLLLIPYALAATSESGSSSASTSATGIHSSSAAHSSPSVASVTSVSVSASSAASSSTVSGISSAASSTPSSVPVSSQSSTISGASTFSPFPVPSQAPVPGVFTSTDPKSPPPVDSRIVPDFAPAWAAAYAKAKKKVAGFSLEEKVSVATGVGWQGGRCVGNIPSVEPVNGRGWPGLCLEDSPLGVRFGDFVTAFPTGVNVAATFNKQLMRLRGLAMGQEHVGKGVNVALGPMMNMGRIAQGGRNWEGFGADPYLTGEAAYETILGMQQAGVQACAKHLINNEQEHKRTESSSDVDDRTQHEIYAHPFLRSVMAGVASIMCSYNEINGTFACENDKVMNDIVKREYGFQGYIMSDWQATHSTLSVVTGLDMTMPGDITFLSGTTYFGQNLTDFVENGTIPEGRVDDMATRILAGWYLLRQDAPGFPKTNFDAFLPDNDDTNDRIDVQDDHYKLVREIGAASTVLLKNVDHALPLKKPRSIVLIGSDAGPGKAGPNQFADQGGNDGVLAMGWGSGTANFTYLISPLDAIQRRAREDRTSVSWFFDDFDLATAGNVARKKSAALVFVNSDSGEQYITVDGNEGDRKNLTAWHGGDNLIQAVAAQNDNTIVIVHSVGPLIVEPWIEHPNVTAVLWAGAPGQEVGNSITDVLYGDYNPSGRLPYTIAKQASDYSAQLVTGGGGSENFLTIPYTEGLEIDYRHFDAKNITPRFEFGFGLSYTSFGYSSLNVAKIPDHDNSQADLIKAWEAGKASPIGQGSSAALWLHRPAYVVSFDVKNTGKVSGTEIPQLYLNMPASSGEPPSLLRGFTNVELGSGRRTTVTMTLSRYDLSFWDTTAQGWRKPEGTMRVTVGASSRDARLHGRIP